MASIFHSNSFVSFFLKKASILSLFLATCVLIINKKAIAQNLSLEWALAIGGKSGDQGRSIATDDLGNVFVAGSFLDTVDFSSGLNPTSKIGAEGSNGMYLAKYDHSGRFEWVRSLGYTFDSYVPVVATDPDGNVLVAGIFTQEISFDLPGGKVTLIAKGYSWENDIYIAKLTSEGEYAWVKHIGGQGDSYVFGITADKSGNVYTTGGFSETCDFNPDASATANITAQGDGTFDIFVSKLDKDGHYVWAKNMGGDYTDYGQSICTDFDNNVYVTGHFTISAEFEIGNLSSIINSASIGSYILKLDSMGRYQWVKGIGGGGTTYGYGISTDQIGNIYTTGWFRSSMLYSSSIPLFSAKGDFDIYVIKADPLGELIWAKQLGGESDDRSRSVAVDKIGNVYLVGYFKDSADFDPGPGEFFLKSNGDFDAFVSKLDSSGNFSWAGSIGGVGSDQALGVAVNNNGNIYTTGYFNRDNVDLDPKLSGAIHSSKGGSDIFIQKFYCSDTSSGFIEVVVCGEDDYTLNGVNYDKDGVYTQILINQRGCDSILILNLMFNSPNPSIRVEEFELSTTLPYQTYQWLLNNEIIHGATGRTYAVMENGSYSVIVSDEKGCVDTSDIYKIDNYVGIENNGDIIRMHIYPNPVRDAVYIKSPVRVNATLSSIEGRMIERREAVTSMDLSGLARGVYLLRLTDENGNLIKVEKLIKKE